MRNEDGFNAGARNFGRLALSCIPWTLGMGALVWLGFFIASHDILHQLSQEQRRAIYVGAFHRPKEKLIIETPKTWCVHITRVDLDGASAAVYYQNDCDVAVGDVVISWQLFSPNRTALESGHAAASWVEGPSSLRVGEQGESFFHGFPTGYYPISTDSRAAYIVFTAGG